MFKHDITKFGNIKHSLYPKWALWSTDHRTRPSMLSADTEIDSIGVVIELKNIIE